MRMVSVRGAKRWLAACGLAGLAIVAGSAAGAPSAAGGPNRWVVGDSPLPADDGTWGRTYYVRPDGGNAKECSGASDNPVRGAVNRECAWAGPMIALPPDGPARIGGGDLLVIRPGSYMIGHGAPGTEGLCSSSYPWDCVMQAVPSGPDPKRPTRVIGGDATRAGNVCKNMPELWGTERAAAVLNLKGTENARIACLDITDHSDCVAFHSGGIRCSRDKFPYGHWAQSGISASDSRNVHLLNLDIHGLAADGISAGRLTDWTVENVRLAANGWAGWNGDLGSGSSSNTGVMRFTKWLVEYNGCGETYPGRRPFKCWAQTAGGYGDGVGTAATGGEWQIENSIFRFNTSDGLDLLYHRGRQPIRINRVWAEGNAGNQIKTNGTVVMTNSVILGTCGHFNGRDITHHVDNCRAMGDALAASAEVAEDTLKFVNNTIVSEGNVAAVVGGDRGSRALFMNNILVGLPFFLGTSKNSADIYLSDRGMTLEDVASLKQDLRSAACGRNGGRCTNAGLLSIDRDHIDIRLKPGSPARNAGRDAADLVGAVDYYGRPRTSAGKIDLGAVESQ